MESTSMFSQVQSLLLPKNLLKSQLSNHDRFYFIQRPVARSILSFLVVGDTYNIHINYRIAQR
jgi:hypothetical protein